jgi:hypothetical protein
MTYISFVVTRFFSISARVPLPSECPTFELTPQCPPSSAPAARALLLCLGTGLLGFGRRSLLQLRWQQQQQ